MTKLNFLNDFMQMQLLRIIFIYIGIYGNAFLVHYSFKNSDSTVFILSIIFLVISIIIHIILNLIIYFTIANSEETKYIFSKDIFQLAVYLFTLFVDPIPIYYKIFIFTFCFYLIEIAVELTYCGFINNIINKEDNFGMNNINLMIFYYLFNSIGLTLYTFLFLKDSQYEDNYKFIFLQFLFSLLFIFISIILNAIQKLTKKSSLDNDLIDSV